ncbi:hypothetical protein HDE_01138 [Halotydeus destructor]|nr:hypothetical protein HDE_01138 [Halotydeus destructor]
MANLHLTVDCVEGPLFGFNQRTNACEGQSLTLNAFKMVVKAAKINTTYIRLGTTTEMLRNGTYVESLAALAENKADVTPMLVGHYLVDPPFSFSAEFVQSSHNILSAKQEAITTVGNLMTSFSILEPKALKYMIFVLSTILFCLVYADCVINRRKSVMSSCLEMLWQIPSAFLNGYYVGRPRLRRLWVPTSLLVFSIITVYDALFKTDLIKLSDPNINSLDQLLASELTPSWFSAITLASYKQAGSGIRRHIWDKAAAKENIRHITYDDKEYHFVTRTSEIFENNLAIINPRYHNEKIDVSPIYVGQNLPDPPFRFSAAIYQSGDTILSAKMTAISTTDHLLTSFLIFEPNTLACLVILLLIILSSLVWSHIMISRKATPMSSSREMSWLMLSAFINGSYDNRPKMRRLWLPTSLLIFTILNAYNGLFKTDLLNVLDTKVNSLEQLLNSNLNPSFLFAVTLGSYRDAKGGIHKRVWDKASAAKTRHATYDDVGFKLGSRLRELHEKQVALINPMEHNLVMLAAICNFSPSRNLWVSKHTFDAFLYSFPFSTTTDEETRRRFDRW